MKWAVLIYNLRTAEEEKTLSSLIIWSDLACITYLIWLRVSKVMIKEVLTESKIMSLV